jgi:hypothetical protein
MPPVVVSYDTKHGRREKRFTDQGAAKRFYIAKDKADKNPKVRKAD